MAGVMGVECRHLATLRAVLTRRQILVGGAVLGAGLIVTACGSNDDGPGAVSSSSSSAESITESASATDPATDGNIDLQVAMLAAGLEVLAVGTYDATLTTAGSGGLGEVPVAVGEFVTVAMTQHQEHLDAWNGLITAMAAA